MRGKVADGLFILALAGITPACAGKRIPAAHRHRQSRDHPRVCGEKDDAGDSAGQMLGSPPRVRGKGRQQTHHDDGGGITPACAGKRGCTRRCGFQNGDHPRVCGEKSMVNAHFCWNRGSPPRVRGKAKTSGGTATATGITPACAGKSDLDDQRRHHDRDHPRVCGEKLAV